MVITFIAYVKYIAFDPSGYDVLVLTHLLITLSYFFF